MIGKILIIEDEKRLRTNLEFLLTEEGYTVSTAANGHEGIAYLQREPFDIVITDIMMEEGNGFEVMEHIATHVPETLIIVITGFASTDSAIEALRKGAYDYISKPFDIEMMKISLKRAMEKIRLQRKLKMHTQDLEQRVIDRTRELHEINQKLNQSLEELKATQERLIQSEKLSALGELLSGVAHELNNPLTSVLGYAELLTQSHSCSPEAHAMLEKISHEAVRCSQIVKNLLSFARKRKPEKRYRNINDICLKTLDLLGYQLKVNNVLTAKQLDDTLPKTMVDEHQLQQVLVNMINNAYQAMAEYRGGGELLITTAHDDRKIYINVTDNGPGISPKNIRRIFDPFYTTKEKGTGLGLSLSYGIIKEHGGEIGVTSIEGKGTTFTIELPIIEELPSSAKTDSLPSYQPVVSPQRVLVIDDEETILEFLTDLLQSLGHQADTTPSGQEALQKIATQEYDLIICDIKMPVVGGRQIYRFLQQNRPHAIPRLIFSSGDTVSEENRKFLEESGCLFLNKPFSIEEFKQILYQGFSRSGDTARSS